MSYIERKKTLIDEAIKERKEILEKLRDIDEFLKEEGIEIENEVAATEEKDFVEKFKSKIQSKTEKITKQINDPLTEKELEKLDEELKGIEFCNKFLLEVLNKEVKESKEVEDYNSTSLIPTGIPKRSNVIPTYDLLDF